MTPEDKFLNTEAGKMISELSRLCLCAADALERYKQAFHQHPYDELIAQLRKASLRKAFE